MERLIKEAKPILNVFFPLLSRGRLSWRKLLCRGVTFSCTLLIGMVTIPLLFSALLPSQSFSLFRWACFCLLVNLGWKAKTQMTANFSFQVHTPSDRGRNQQFRLGLPALRLFLPHDQGNKSDHSGLTLTGGTWEEGPTLPYWPVHGRAIMSAAQSTRRSWLCCLIWYICCLLIWESFWQYPSLWLCQI